MMDASLCSLKDDMYGDLFSSNDHRLGRDFVHFHDEHDMSMDSWKFLGDLTYDSSNEESENFEDLGRPISDEISQDAVH